MYKFAFLLLLSSLAFAERPVSVRGEISQSGATPLIGYSIELSIPTQQLNEHRAPIASGGTFDMPGVSPGTYQARILRDNRLVYTTWVTIRPDGGFVQIDLPEPKSPERPVSGTISARRLAHKPAKAAVKEMIRAADARKKGDLQKSLEHLEKAVELDPDYVEAHVNLGARYVELDRNDDAEAAFERAAKLDPHCAPALSNLALIHITKGKIKEAETIARRAVDADAGSARAHFVLAYSLAMQDATSEEALSHFMRASNDFPQARVAAAQVLMRRGENGRAQKELKAYLNTGDEAQRAMAQGFLSRLQQ